jgi:nicotinamidase/pyrazinamidase
MQPYDPTTALIIVDMQNDFADPDGALSVAGGAGLIPTINRAAQAAVQAGAFVVYTQDWHPEQTPHFADYGGIWPVHCVTGSWGASFHPDLEVVGPSVQKGSNGEDGYSGFTMRDPVSGTPLPTEMASLLSDRGIRRVLVCGLATDYCVKATALDAARLGFETTVLSDAIAPVDLEPGDGERAIEELRRAGVAIEPARS